jgi:peptidoglycan L-alanyl-D-glutamate endopeptidase CwlK
MYSFSKNSQKHFDTCHAQLQLVLLEAIKYYDFSVVCGHRGQFEQDLAYAKGFSKLKFPKSKHNALPSNAFDIYPYHSQYGSLTEDAIVVKRIQSRIARTPNAVIEFIRAEYCVMAGIVLTASKIVGVELRWGGDWNSDGNRLDNTFNDLAHFELV